ncbi:MAG: hypothetical protein K0R15_915 [Clostridiales bacterium]|jgi:predicted lysophospholipase L1 biosynthesis ABC-type transport system permease subunit|nr:hypothetical protein [Clostridiales bacterium]
MKPFNAAYYISHNKSRAIALMLLIASIVFIYIGGLYISTFEHMAEYSYKLFNEYTYIFPNYGCSEEEFNSILADFNNSESIGSVINVNTAMALTVTNELSISNDINVLTFANTEDANRFFSIIFPNENINLVDGEIALSSKVAKNCKLKIGDTINQDSEEGYNIDKEYKIVQIIDSEYFFAYGIDKGVKNTYLIVRPEALDKNKDIAINQFVNFIKSRDYGDKVTIRVYEDILDRIQQQVKSIDYLYYGIIILLIIILSVTVNATFLGAYEKRQFEFSIYKAIGISKKSISFKIMKEVLLINLFGVGVAVIIALSVVWLSNELYYYSMGLLLKYFNLRSLISTVVCDVLVIVPVILLRIRKIRKYDITEY